MIFGKKKKEEIHRGDVFLAKGIYLKKPDMDNGHVLLNAFLRSLIVFLLVFGSLGCFLSSFDIAYNFVMVFVVFMALSMYFSMLYSTSRLLFRDIGYILFFVVFLGAIYIFKLYANSGLYFIVNTVLLYAENFFNLSGVRQYEVTISNSYLTVSILECFIGMVLIIVLNIWISSAMSIVWTFIFTVPLMFVPLYMKLSPSPFYIVCMCVGYIAIMIFKANGHFVTFSWDSAFRIRGLKKDKVTYTQDAKAFRQIFATILAFSLVLVVLVETVFPDAVFKKQFHSEKLWDQTSDSIGNFLLLGFSSFYNRYASTGGLSGGKLGGVSSVRPDYQTDLVVTFTPYTYEVMYLKGYTGGLYGENEWISIYKDDAYTDASLAFKDDSMQAQTGALQAQYDAKTQDSAKGLMNIYNKGAAPYYLYYPYYTSFDENTEYSYYEDNRGVGGLGLMKSTSYEYYPKQVWDESLLQKKPSEQKIADVNPIYLQVPKKNEQVIDNFCKEIGLSENMTVEEIVTTVDDYFLDNIPYTLKPGSTPRDEDFVNYFIEHNRKGYCAHFASAGTLILRHMGIPARYVEGYAMPFETVLASEEDTSGLTYEDMYDGYSLIGDSTVLSVEVSDAMAHAWVEIYVDGFGWKTIELTPGSAEEADEDDFWSAFTRMLQNSDIADGGQDTDNGFEIDLMKYSFVIYIFLGIICFILLLVILKNLLGKLRRYMRCHQKNQREAIIATYANDCDKIRLCRKDFDGCRSHREQLQYIKSYYMQGVNVEYICKLLEYASFSQGELSKEQIKVLWEFTNELSKAIWKNEKLLNKLRMIKR